MTENNFNFANGVSYDVWYEQKRLIDQLKKENEELKEKFKKFFGIDNQKCWDIAFLKDENARYKQALDEIEELATCKESDIETNNAIWLHKYILVKSCQILDIIREVKGEENDR